MAEQSKLEIHAEKEMRRAGLYDADSDYGGMIPDAVMALIQVLASQGHSGNSHALVMQIFNRVANFKPLTPLTNDPEEWVDVSHASGGNAMWQNRRDSSFFSADGGKTGYSINDKERTIKTFADARHA